MKKKVNFFEAVKQDRDFRCVETGTKYRLTVNGDVITLDNKDRFLDYVTFNKELMTNSLFLVDSKVSKCDTCNGSRFEKYVSRKQELNRLCITCNGTGVTE